MPIKVSLDIRRSFHVPASPEQVFDVLADVPESVSHYPEVAELIDEGDGVFRWVMEEVGLPGFGHVVEYASRYVGDREAGTVEWTPIERIGNALITGAWQISGTGSGSGTTIDFRTEGTLTIPGPALLGGAIKAVAANTFRRQVDEYIANLEEAFG